MPDGIERKLIYAREALADATANLVASVSAYEKYAGNVGRRSIRDPFFNTRLNDFQKSIDRVRKNLIELDSTIAKLNIEC